MGTRNLRGKVSSGSGEGAKFVSLDWTVRQVEETVGFTPYPGTLNLRLLGEGVAIRRQIEKKVVARICPQTGYCAGLICKASIYSINCAIVIPLLKDYPIDVLEVIAPVNLRKALKIHDGDEVSVSVTV